MIYGFRSGHFYLNGEHEFWADMDGQPVEARNYAQEVFRFDETEHVDELIREELDSFFRGRWVSTTGDYTTHNVATTWDSHNVFPFEVIDRIVLIRKYYSPTHGWTEEPYAVPDDYEEMMAPAIEPKVWIDCD